MQAKSLGFATALPNLHRRICHI